jgi:hypothetical protein
MAIPKATRTTKQINETPIDLPAVELTCKITGQKFMGYKDQLPISPEAWNSLTELEKYEYSFRSEA